MTPRILAAVTLAALAVIAAVGALDPRDAALGWMVGQRLATSVAMGSLLWLALGEVSGRLAREPSDPRSRAWLFEVFAGAPPTERRRTRAQALLLLGVPAWCLYSVDAWMTLDPGWKSSVFALVVVAAGVRDGLAALILLTTTTSTSASRRVPRDLWHALGRLVLTVVLMSVYFPFSQLLALASAGLPDELGDYAARWHGPVRIASLALIAGTVAIALPLVFRPFEGSGLAIGLTAAEVVVLGALEATWDLVPHGDPAVAGALAAVSLAAWGAGIAAVTWWGLGEAQGEDLEGSHAYRSR